MALVDQADWNQAMRGETELQRADRNFVELLQELRVAQTGGQILFAFLLGLAFTPRFPELTAAQQAVYLATLLLSAASAALLIAPVAYHRMFFQRRLKRLLVTTSHRCTVVGLVLLLLSLAGGVHLAASFVLGAWATALAGGLVLLLAVLWFGVPVWQRASHAHVPPPEDAAGR